MHANTLFSTVRSGIIPDVTEVDKIALGILQTRIYYLFGQRCNLVNTSVKILSTPRRSYKFVAEIVHCDGSEGSWLLPFSCCDPKVAALLIHLWVGFAFRETMVMDSTLALHPVSSVSRPFLGDLLSNYGCLIPDRFLGWVERLLPSMSHVFGPYYLFVQWIAVMRPFFTKRVSRDFDIPVDLAFHGENVNVAPDLSVELVSEFLEQPFFFPKSIWISTCPVSIDDLVAYDTSGGRFNNDLLLNFDVAGNELDFGLNLDGDVDVAIRYRMLWHYDLVANVLDPRLRLPVNYYHFFPEDEEDVICPLVDLVSFQKEDGAFLRSSMSMSQWLDKNVLLHSPYPNEKGTLTRYIFNVRENLTENFPTIYGRWTSRKNCLWESPEFEVSSTALPYGEAHRTTTYSCVPKADDVVFANRGWQYYIDRSCICCSSKPPVHRLIKVGSPSEPYGSQRPCQLGVAKQPHDCQEQVGYRAPYGCLESGNDPLWVDLVYVYKRLGLLSFLSPNSKFDPTCSEFKHWPNDDFLAPVAVVSYYCSTDGSFVHFSSEDGLRQCFSSALFHSAGRLSIVIAPKSHGLLPVWRDVHGFLPCDYLYQPPSGRVSTLVAVPPSFAPGYECVKIVPATIVVAALTVLIHGFFQKAEVTVPLLGQAYYPLFFLNVLDQEWPTPSASLEALD